MRAMKLNRLLAIIFLLAGMQVAMGQAKAPAPVASTPAPAASASAASVPSAAAAVKQASVDLHPWQAALPRLIPEAYFTNLTNGDSIETPFLVKFGLSGGWGLAPIAKPIAGKTGHHHLLVDRDLPLDFKQALPFTDQYIHFGKGQMESVLNLPPGKYKLRLLLADDKHLPHFVYSKPMNITVTKKNAVDPKSLVKRGVELMVASGELVKPFRLQFHASGMNVAHKAQAEKDTGHFKLTLVNAKGGQAVEMDFVNGQTEVWLEPPAGDYTARLDFVDNLKPGAVLFSAAPKTIKVP
jgi:Domain of unknown function (DUF4399)